MAVEIIKGFQRRKACVKKSESLIFQLPVLQVIHNTSAKGESQKPVRHYGNGGMHRQPKTSQFWRQGCDLTGGECCYKHENCDERTDKCAEISDIISPANGFSNAKKSTAKLSRNLKSLVNLPNMLFI